MEKENQLQTRILPPPMDAPPTEPIYFEPLDKDVPSSSTQVSKDLEELTQGYTIVGPSAINPRETDLEKELKVLHSTCIHKLAAEAIHTDYHMPTLP